VGTATSVLGQWHSFLQSIRKNPGQDCNKSLHLSRKSSKKSPANAKVNVQQWWSVDFIRRSHLYSFWLSFTEGLVKQNQSPDGARWPISKYV